MQLSHLYILANASRTFLYIGASDNLPDQLFEHKFVESASFSKETRPVHLIYFENFDSLEQAVSRACEVKAWRDSQKWQFIMAANPCLDELLWLDAETTAA